MSRLQAWLILPIDRDTPGWTVTRILRAEEEVDVPRLEAVLGGAEVDPVEDEVQIVAVGLDLGVVDVAEGILDGELVEVKDGR